MYLLIEYFISLMQLSFYSSCKPCLPALRILTSFPTFAFIHFHNNDCNIIVRRLLIYTIQFITELFSESYFSSGGMRVQIRVMLKNQPFNLEQHIRSSSRVKCVKESFIFLCTRKPAPKIFLSLLPLYHTVQSSLSDILFLFHCFSCTAAVLIFYLIKFLY
jgi:hypothetical protein